jgi:drug/metabolite transporter (DMT)-like permease
LTYLLLSILSQSVYVQGYKIAVEKGYDGNQVNTISYLAAFTFLLGRSLGVRLSFNIAALFWGLALGVFGFIATLTFFYGIRYGSLGISWTIISLASLIPTLASISIWWEVPDFWGIFALILTVVSIGLMGNTEIRRVRRPRKWLLWIGISYLASGFGMITFKIVGESQPGGSGELFLLTSYATAFLIGLGIFFRRTNFPTPGTVLTGIVRGGAQALTNVTFLLSVQILPGYVIFPAYGSGGVLTTVVISVLIWQEKLVLRSLIGILLALSAILMFSWP